MVKVWKICSFTWLRPLESKYPPLNFKKRAEWPSHHFWQPPRPPFYLTAVIYARITTHCRSDSPQPTLFLSRIGICPSRMPTLALFDSLPPTLFLGQIGIYFLFFTANHRFEKLPPKSSFCLIFGINSRSELIYRFILLLSEWILYFISKNQKQNLC